MGKYKHTSMAYSLSDKYAKLYNSSGSTYRRRRDHMFCLKHSALSLSGYKLD